MINRVDFNGLMSFVFGVGLSKISAEVDLLSFTNEIQVVLSFNAESLNRYE
jgi:hypothetical protein